MPTMISSFKTKKQFLAAMSEGQEPLLFDPCLGMIVTPSQAPRKGVWTVTNESRIWFSQLKRNDKGVVKAT